MTRTRTVSLWKLIQQFETAAREHEIVGSAAPEDRAGIEADYKELRDTLRRAVKGHKVRVTRTVEYLR